MADAELLTIGEVARRSGLTAKALRHYDRIGLLLPATVDGAGGIRRYAPEQVSARLRAVELPLDQVRTYLAAEPEAAEAILHAHRTRMQARATRLAGSLHALTHLITDGMAPIMTDTRPTGSDVLAAEDERRLASQLFNATWTLLEQEDRSRADDDRMLHMAHASRYHWGQVGTAANLARGEWQCSRVYAVLERSEPCLHHAQRVLDICQDNGIGDWDLGFAHEALARGHAVAGDKEMARLEIERALAAVEGIADDEDRAILLADLETIPGQPRFW
jgi:DNA-binding transcriptional MerR regulator